MVEALEYAANAHGGQARKGKREPYLSHILTVAALVALRRGLASIGVIAGGGMAAGVGVLAAAPVVAAAVVGATVYFAGRSLRRRSRKR